MTKCNGQNALHYQFGDMHVVIYRYRIGYRQYNARSGAKIPANWKGLVRRSGKPDASTDELGTTKGGKPKDVFDVNHIEKIVQLMERHDLREVDGERFQSVERPPRRRLRRRVQSQHLQCISAQPQAASLASCGCGALSVPSKKRE